MSTKISQQAGPILIIFTTVSPTNNTQRVRTEPEACQSYFQVRPQRSIKVSRHCQLICMPCFTWISPRQPTIRTNSKIRMVSAEDTTKQRIPQVKWLSTIIHLPSCYISRHPLLCKLIYTNGGKTLNSDAVIRVSSACRVRGGG